MEEVKEISVDMDRHSSGRFTDIGDFRTSRFSGGDIVTMETHGVIGICGGPPCGSSAFLRATWKNPLTQSG